MINTHNLILSKYKNPLSNTYWMSNVIQTLILMIGWVYNKLSGLHRVNILFRSFHFRSLFTLFHFEQMALLHFFLSNFLQNLILLIVVCYWQYFSVFTSYLALGKGNKENISWIILKIWRSIFPQTFLPCNLPLHKYPSFKINVLGNMYTHIHLFTFVYIKKDKNICKV